MVLAAVYSLSQQGPVPVGALAPTLDLGRGKASAMAGIYSGLALRLQRGGRDGAASCSRGFPRTQHRLAWTVVLQVQAGPWLCWWRPCPTGLVGTVALWVYVRLTLALWVWAGRWLSGYELDLDPCSMGAR